MCGGGWEGLEWGGGIAGTQTEVFGSKGGGRFMRVCKRCESQLKQYLTKAKSNHIESALNRIICRFCVLDCGPCVQAEINAPNAHTL